MTSNRARNIERIIKGLEDTTYEDYGIYSVQSYFYEFSKDGGIIKNNWGKITVYATAEDVASVRRGMELRTY